MKLKILLFILIPVLGQSQPYHKLIEPNKYWDLAYYSGGSVCNIDSGWASRNYFDSDTLMPNGLLYKKVYKYPMLSTMPWLYCPPFNVDTLSYLSYLFIREDTIQKKVYTYVNQDELIYDFNLNQGDTLNSLYAGAGVLQTVDSTALGLFPDGTTRKIIYLRNGQFYIEGIGSPTSGLGEPMPLFWVPSGYYIMCVKHNGIDLIGQVCNSLFLGIPQFTSKNNLQIYPSPASQSVTIKIDGEFILKVLDMEGKSIIEKKCNNEFIFNCVNSPKGVYIFHVETKNETYNRRVVINGT